MRELRKQQRSDEENIATLKGELAEKKKNLQSMQERVCACFQSFSYLLIVSILLQLKKFRSENQEVKNVR